MTAITAGAREVLVANNVYQAVQLIGNSPKCQSESTLMYHAHLISTMCALGLKFVASVGTTFCQMTPTTAKLWLLKP